MEFKRINKDTVTCIITEDDMFEQGIKLEDLFEKKKEAMDFLHDVMKKAEEEVDYKPTGSFLPLQMTVLPDHSISLTMSENASASFGEILKNLTEKAGIKIPKNVLEDLGDSVDEERIQRLNEYLKSLKELTGSVKDIIEPVISDDKGDSIVLNENATIESTEAKADSITVRAPKVTDQKQKDLNRLKFHEYIFSFDDIKTIISFSGRVSKELRIKSTLYKNNKDGRYYLDLVRGEEDPKVFASLFTMAYEFGRFEASNPQIISFIRENYDKIISEDALKQLSELETD